MCPYALSIVFLACARFAYVHHAAVAWCRINYARLLLGEEGVLYLVEKTTEGGIGLVLSQPVGSQAIYLLKGDLHSQ